jgi:hypothetical protein
MTEEEWLTSDDPGALVTGMHRRVSPRKFLLIVCACYRRFVAPAAMGLDRRAVERVEAYAEGTASAEEMLRLGRKTERHEGPAKVLFANGIGGTGGFWGTPFGQMHAGWQTASSLIDDITRRKPGRPSRQAARALIETKAALVTLVRDVVENPFRPRPSPFAGLEKPDGNVLGLARAIYEEGRSETWPILADALEEAGCTDRAILDHCRKPGEHIRGCWLLDGLLGLE